MARITHAERVELADNAYLKGRTEIEAPLGWVIAEQQEFKSGLEIYALRKENTNEVVFAVRGSDADGKDWAIGGPNLSHIAGKLHEQDKEALSFVDKFKEDNKLPDGSDKFYYSVTGDSKGGAISQIIAHTFGMRGTTTDPAAGGGVVKDPAYLEFVRNNLKTVSEPLGVPKGQFLNIREEGSPVPIGSEIFPGTEHLGETVTFDYVLANKFDALFNPFDTFEGQHTNRTERITALNNTHPPGEVDPIFVLFNDKISSLTSEINKLEEKLAVLANYQNLEREDIKEIENIERNLRSLQDKKNEDQVTRGSLITGEYGDANGFVDQWAKSYLENVTSTNNPWVTNNIVLPAGKVVTQEDADPLADNFIPPELHSSQLFFLPNDRDIYILTSVGKIIKSLALSSSDGGGESVVVNGDNLPTTREELLAQLEELGVPSDEAKAIADGNKTFSESNNPPEPSTTFLGLDADLWTAMSAVAAAVQTIEQVGDDVTGLIQAFKYGSDWEAFEATVNLLKSLDTVAGLSEGYKVLSDEQSAAIQGTSSLVGAIGDIIRLQQALETGDDWAIASSTTSMIDNGIKAFNHFNETPGTHPTTTPGAIGAAYSGAAASIVGLGLSVRQMTDAFDSGDAIAKMQATLSVVQSGLSTYVAVSHATAAMTTGSTALTGTTQALGNAMPAIGCAIGVVQGLLSIADGDVQGGSEQIALAIVSYALCAIPVFGVFIALALQLASATRNCDGQIIDTENIEEFTDNIAPAGAEAAHAAINIIEEPAEVANDVYEKSIYYSGYNVDMLAKQGVDIPNDLQGSFGFAQMNAEFFSPLRYAHYFEDLDEMSVADIWDSLYISQSIAKTIAVFYVKKVPPQATVGFTLNENGQVATSLSGDARMRETAISCAASAAGVMGYYQANGGRLLIDGKLPSLTLVRGEDSTISYRSGTGGKVTVIVGDMANIQEQMLGVLYARDRGERIDSAIKTASDVDGYIDVNKVDAILARYGFGKTGITYTYGETGSRTAKSWGSGIFHGGGNVGLEGQLFTAKASDFTSLPLRPEQMPKQQLGEILRIVSLNNLFSGPGAELMAMALGLSGGLLGLARVAGAENNTLFANSDYAKPLAGAAKDKYVQTPNESAQPEKAVTALSSRLPIPDFSDPEAMQQFLSQHWPELLADAWPPPETAASGAYYYRDTIGYDGLLADGSRAPWWKHEQTQDFYQQQVQKGVIDSGFMEEADTSFSGHLIAPEDAVLPQPLPGIEQGAIFTMAEDSILRFLPSQLAENTLSGGYGKTAETFTFVSFGAVQNGRVWLDTNGDIRFAPTPGFVGTGSFIYTVISPTGELVERIATVLVQNVNDLPQLQDDTFSLAEGEIFYLDRLLANDSDPEGDSLLLDHFRGVEHGKVAMVGGRLAFIPDEGYHGDIEFTYWVRDHADAYPVMARVTLAYNDVNTGATPADDRFIIMEDTPLIVSTSKLLANDVEHDGEAITFAGLGAATHGTVEMQPDGSILFTPEQDYAGTGAGFLYRVQDASGNISTGWVAVEVLDKREAPIVLSNTREPLLEDHVLTFSPDEVAKFIHDADGDAVHLERITNVIGGSIAVRNGYYAFIPNADYFGPASFDYLANDNHRGTVEGHLQFEIAPVNDAINTGTDILTTKEEQPVSTTVAALLAGDSDVDGTVFTFAGLGASLHGTVTVDGGTITFTPDADYFGSAAGFEYLVEDSEGLASVGWVQVLVAGVNDAPQSTGSTLTLLEDQPLIFDTATIAGFINDADGDVITITDIGSAVGGVVSESGGIFTFTPDADYHGPGSVLVTAIDGKGATLTTTLTLDILPADDPTLFTANLFTTGEEQPLTVTAAALLAGATDVDGALTFVGLGSASHGTVAMSGGTITFTPDIDYFGSGAGFEYLVRDPEGNAATGWAAVQVENVNDPPTIIATTLQSPEDQQIVFDAATISRFISDLDGDTITLTEITAASGGTISEDAGVYTFTPGANFHGPASVAYSATDGHGTGLSGVLNLDILSQNDPTDFGVDSFVIEEEQPLVTSVAELMANDSDADGLLEFVGLGAASHGQVRMTAAGIIEFMPENNYFGEEAGFAYIVRDGEARDATGWVTIKVENVNDVPQIIGNRVHILEDQALSFTLEEVAKFITDADGDLLHLDMVKEVTGGRMELNGGIYTFIPDADFYGEASFAYLAKNSQGEEVSGNLSLGIAPVNDLPKTTFFATTGIEDHEISLSVATLMAGATDIEDGGDLRFGGIDSSLHGDVYVDPQGMIHFLPDKDFSGSAFFRYYVLDSEGGVGIGYVGAEIEGENDPPVAMNDEKILAWSNNSYENIYMAATFLANDYDVDFDPLRIVSVGAAEFGTVSVDGAGNIHYLAAADEWVGIDTFTYKISDDSGSFSEATATIDVKINTSPDVYSELLYTREDIISILAQQDLLANDSDIDGDIMRIVAVDQAEHCQVDILADGAIRFIPELNYNNLYPGQASFRYTVSDGISDPVTAVAFFDIEPVNDAPILQGERIVGAVEDNSFAFAMVNLLANDSDVEMASPYEEDSIAFAGVWGAGHGSIAYDPGSGTIYYVPDANFCGVETFSYSVVDSHGAESVVQSEIYVEPVNDYPVVQYDYGEAEDSVWNYYSIGNLVGNDVDVDGDSLTILNPRILEGGADVQISGGDLMVKPVFREDRVVVGYTVSDGHGGEVDSELHIESIREHNFAPEFSGIYQIAWKNAYTVWFNFHAEDRNGGNTWGDSGDIVSISASAPTVGTITDEGYTFKFKGDVEKASVVLTAVDQAGATGSIYINLANLAEGDGDYIYSPVVLDLDGDGVELLDLSAGVGFDWNLDGNTEGTGWAGKDDGFLVYDYDHDRVVRYANELALKEYEPQANTDLEGLLAFDTNKNGIFDAADDEWQAFGVWQDKNSNGKTDDQEFATLGERGITAITLASDKNFQEVEGNIVFGQTTFQWANGTTGVAADVGIIGGPVVMVEMSGAMPVGFAGDKEVAGVSSENITDDVAGVSEAAVTPAQAGAVELSDKTNGAPDTINGVDVPGAPVEPAGGQATAADVEIQFDDAEINRLSNQLHSDIAAYSADDIVISIPPVVEPICGMDLLDPMIVVGQEVQAIS
ncbi:MAG: tandem-95 repeat protein [Proteobacteria bacterium]|nr:tandem-95 repeat protein [Pseudomonadota bacterium]